MQSRNTRRSRIAHIVAVIALAVGSSSCVSRSEDNANSAMKYEELPTYGELEEDHKQYPWLAGPNPWPAGGDEEVQSVMNGKSTKRLNKASKSTSK